MTDHDPTALILDAIRERDEALAERTERRIRGKLDAADALAEAATKLERHIWANTAFKTSEEEVRIRLDLAIGVSDAVFAYRTAEYRPESLDRTLGDGVTPRGGLA